MSTEKRPLFGLVIGVKRYDLATLDDAGDLLEVVEATEHALGGSVVDPSWRPSQNPTLSSTRRPDSGSPSYETTLRTTSSVAS